MDSKGASSLAAIYMACQSLLKGECRLAIAGGVNLTLHPHKYMGLCNLNQIATHPSMRSFSRGDGFIPAEGIGAVLLKPLHRAEKDGDFIFAVIKSATLCNEGHTLGLSVPNPRSQARFFQDHFEISEINPESVSYVEADANGTQLSDLAEFDALSRVFSKDISKKQFCAIGSVKANIGDPEAASGIAQLAKVVLQLQHKKLVPTLSMAPINPDLNLDDSPFYLPDSLQDWNRPVISGEGREQEIPRRALVHSSGQGGTNVSLIVEEYIPSEKTANLVFSESLSPQIFVFSALSSEQLVKIARQVSTFITNNSISLFDLAYTLHKRKEAMPCRLAIVASTHKGLLAGIETYLKRMQENGSFEEEIITDAEESTIRIYAGNSEKIPAQMKHLLSGRVQKAFVQALLEENNPGKIAYYWSQGGNIDWEIAGNAACKIIPDLPTYPFDKRRYWIAPPGANPVQRFPEKTMSMGIPYIPETELSDQSNMYNYLNQVVHEITGISAEQINPDTPVKEYGEDPSLQLKLMRAIEEAFEVKITQREMEEYPSLSSLSKYLAEKADDNRFLPEASLQEKTSILSIKIDDMNRIPLSEGQKGLWVLQQAYPYMRAYNLPLALHLNTSVDVDALKKAVEFTGKKFPILKTAIRDENSTPYLLILPESEIPIQQIPIDRIW